MAVKLVAALAALVLACSSLAPAHADPWSARGAVPAPTHAGHERRAFYAPMADGVQLAITVYTPAEALPGTPATTKFPLILWYLPGHRESIDPATGRITPAFSRADIAFFTSHGYALAAAEMRGSGASFGARELDRGPQIGRDGRQLVDWIAAQPWSNGAVGMVGASYQGFSQYATAAERPAALRAIFPEIAGFDDYTSMFHPGGIGNVALSQFASASIVRDDQNHYDPQATRPRLPSVPVIDEDGDGELADEIPLDRNGNGNFLDDGEPRYRDGQPRLHLYYRATRDHLANANLTVEAVLAAPHRDSALGGTPYTYADLGPGRRPLAIARSGIAVYHRGGWFDYHARDTVMWHATLAGHTPSHLMMAPTGHGGFPSDEAEALYRAGPYFALAGDTASTQQRMNEEKLRFFDRYLRGVQNGFDRLPPVLLHVVGQGWRSEQEWPLARQRLTAWHLDAGGLLTPGRPSRGRDRHVLPPTADSRSQGANRWNYGTSAARAPLALANPDPVRASYTTAVLTQDLEVTGHPLVTLKLSSDAPDGDVFVYLEDITPEGQALLVSEGQLRANYPRLQPIQQLLAGVTARQLAVKPALPWHGYRRQDDVPRVFASGKPVELTLDLMPTAWVFKAGHRLRLSIAAADTPSFAPHPAVPVTGPSPTWTIWRGRGMSRIVLPVIP